MNDFGRFMNEFNTSMQQMVQTMNQMQGLYKSFSQLSPMWKGLYEMFQAQEQQLPTEQVRLSRTKGRQKVHHKSNGIKTSRRYSR